MTGKHSTYAMFTCICKYQSSREISIVLEVYFGDILSKIYIEIPIVPNTPPMIIDISREKVRSRRYCPDGSAYRNIALNYFWIECVH